MQSLRVAAKGWKEYSEQRRARSNKAQRELWFRPHAALLFRAHAALLYRKGNPMVVSLFGVVVGGSRKILSLISSSFVDFLPSFLRNGRRLSQKIATSMARSFGQPLRTPSGDAAH